MKMGGAVGGAVVGGAVGGAWKYAELAYPTAEAADHVPMEMDCAAVRNTACKGAVAGAGLASVATTGAIIGAMAVQGSLPARCRP